MKYSVEKFIKLVAASRSGNLQESQAFLGMLASGEAVYAEVGFSDSKVHDVDHSRVCGQKDRYGITLFGEDTPNMVLRPSNFEPTPGTEAAEKEFGTMEIEGTWEEIATAALAALNDMESE